MLKWNYIILFKAKNKIEISNNFIGGIKIEKFCFLKNRDFLHIVRYGGQRPKNTIFFKNCRKITCRGVVDDRVQDNVKIFERKLLKM